MALWGRDVAATVYIKLLYVVQGTLMPIGVLTIRDFYFP
jgi:hypothetical protein